MVSKSIKVLAAYALISVLFVAFLPGITQAGCIYLKFFKTGGNRVKVTFQIFNNGDDVMLFARGTDIDYLSQGDEKALDVCNGTMQGNWLYKAVIKLDSTSTSWTSGRTVGNLPINSIVECHQSGDQFECHKQ